MYAQAFRQNKGTAFVMLNGCDQFEYREKKVGKAE